MKEKGEGLKKLRTIPIILAVALVPLFTFAKRYEVNLTKYDWFSNDNSSTDIFLYWKGQALIALAFLIFLFVLLSVCDKKTNLDWKRNTTIEMICLFAFLGLTLLSGFLSKFGEVAIWGGYEQWEGAIVILAYGILFWYGYMVLDTKKAMMLVIYGLAIGGFVEGLIGTMQYLGGVFKNESLDLFRTSFGNDIMNLMLTNKAKFHFNFPLGWVYGTVYNPNYIGSYAALLIPILITLALLKWGKINKVITVIASAAMCLMVVTLVGSQSLTGCIGVIASIIIYLVFKLPKLKELSKKGKIIFSLTAFLALVIMILAAIFVPSVNKAVKKTFSPSPDYHMVKEMISTDEGLKITHTRDCSFYVNLTNDSNNSLVLSDGSNNLALNTSKIENGRFTLYTIVDWQYPKIGFIVNDYTINDTTYHGFQVLDMNINIKWDIVKVDNEYKFYTKNEKLASFAKIDSIGFERCLHFADKRGYIWSRTIPLLKDYILLGSGPNTFTEIFPNNDYVGKNNLNYNGVTVTKPHNMYLQIWTQTGFLSLLAFILIYIIYMINSVKLYWNKEKKAKDQLMSSLGFATFLSITGYMVTGLANDSTVSVAPIFWGMLGLGYAINLYNKKVNSENVIIDGKDLGRKSIANSKSNTNSKSKKKNKRNKK